MKPVYLSESSKNEKLLEILERMVPQGNIHFFETKEQASELLKQEFSLLILPGDCIDVSAWKELPKKGQIHIYNAIPVDISDKVRQKTNIYLHQDMEELQNHLKELYRIYQKKQKNKGLKKTDTNEIESKAVAKNTPDRQSPAPSQEEEQETKQEEIKTDTTETSAANQLQKREVHEDEEEQPLRSPFTYERLKFKAVNLANYPKGIEEGWKEDPYAGLKEILQKNYKSNRNNKTIGIWSPVDNFMDLHFTMNLAIYLAESDVKVGVLETLNKKPKLYKQLSQYQEPPKNWISIMHPVFSNKPYQPEQARWTYQKVDWHPLSDDIIYHVKWNQDDIVQYLSVLSYYDIGLALLPTEEMLEETKYALEMLNELWVLVDGRKEVEAWKTYIHDIADYYPNIDIHLIHINCTSKDQSESLAEKMDLPVLTTVPVMLNELHGCKNDTNPPILKYAFRRKFKPAFRKIQDYVFEKPQSSKAKTAILDFLGIASPKLEKTNKNLNL